MRPDARYPVVESVPLNPLPARFLRSSRRRFGELPQQAEGSVLVFQCNDRFSVAPTGPRMLLSEVVVKATMVAVVLTRSQVVPAVAALPSVSPGRRLVLRASYNCTVVDPVRVLEVGCWDVRTELLEYLLSDTRVRMLGAREDVTENPEVSQRILARTFARNELDPPVIPGMRVRLVDVTLGVQEDAASMGGSHQSFDEADAPPRYQDRFGDEEAPRDAYGTYSPDGDD